MTNDEIRTALDKLRSIKGAISAQLVIPAPDGHCAVVFLMESGPVSCKAADSIDLAVQNAANDVLGECLTAYKIASDTLHEMDVVWKELHRGTGK